MEELAKLPLPEAFLEFLRENELDPSIYTAVDSIPRYIRYYRNYSHFCALKSANFNCFFEFFWLFGKVEGGE